MFNLGPMELVVLAIVAIVVIGPEKLPRFAKDAASFLKTVRDMATGARQQLRDELGPEFADVDFRNFNPRTAVTRAVFGDDNPRSMMRDAVYGDDDDSFRDDLRGMDPRRAVRDATASYKASYSTDYSADYAADEPSVNGNGHANGHASGVDLGKTTGSERPRPRPRPSAPPASYGDDIT